jgi:hypothetical protein
MNKEVNDILNTIPFCFNEIEYAMEKMNEIFSKNEIDYDILMAYCDAIEYYANELNIYTRALSTYF